MGVCWFLKITPTSIYARFGSFWTSRNHPNQYICKVWELFEFLKSSEPVYTQGLGAFWILEIIQTIIYVKFGSCLCPQHHASHYICNVCEFCWFSMGLIFFYYFKDCYLFSIVYYIFCLWLLMTYMTLQLFFISCSFFD